MFERSYRTLIEGKFGGYPAVVLTGPRQCGKTTLARSMGGAYFDMESQTGFLGNGGGRAGGSKRIEHGFGRLFS